MQYGVINTGIPCLYGSQHLSVVFACKTVTFGAELQVSMCHSSHLWFLHTQEGILDQNFKSVRVPHKTCRFLHGKQQLLDSNNKSLRVPDITCRFVHAIQRDLHQNYLSLWVPALICVFSLQNSDFWTRITYLYGSQTSPVVLCMQYSVISTRITCLYGSQTLSVVFAFKTATFGLE